MTAAIVYIDISEVREGALDELKAGLKDLVDFIEANEPRLVAYNIYFSADVASSSSSSRCPRSTSTASRARRRWSRRMRRRDCWEAALWRSRPHT